MSGNSSYSSSSSSSSSSNIANTRLMIASLLIIGLFMNVLVLLRQSQPCDGNSVSDVDLSSALPTRLLAQSQQGGQQEPGEGDTTSATTTTRTSTQSNLRWDSSDATVISMSHGYQILDHKRFVGSLRKSGFTGNILLATESDLRDSTREYFDRMNVTHAGLNFIDCDHNTFTAEEMAKMPKGSQTLQKMKEANKCIDPYPDIKVRWGRYPYLRDLLANCESCTGPVLMTDARDTFFQRDPFGDGIPEIQGLQLYAENHVVNARHQFIYNPIRKCRKFFFNETDPMLCSGTVVAPRDEMLKFIDLMYEEFRWWMKMGAANASNPEGDCYVPKAGGDQAIMNYLYYSGKLTNLRPTIYYSRQVDGIVNTVGALGTRIGKANINLNRLLGAHNITNPYRPKPDKKGKTLGGSYWGSNFRPNGMWLGEHMAQTDSAGYFINIDGKRSRVVHQWDRFGNAVAHWMDRGVLYDK